ncbi:hypothetical protein OIE99_29170 [Streptomyces cellulosae]|nr:hypothetical protein OIE99_29170 [Streptomyces cellulosae]
MQRPGLLGRVHSQPVREPAAQRLVRLDGLGATAEAVQPGHEVADDQFVVRMLVGQCVQLVEEFGPAAEPQFAFVALHQRRQPLPFEQPAGPLGPLPRDPAEGPAAPDAERLPEQPYGGAGVRPRGPGPGHGPAEAVQVDRVGLDLQHVPAVPPAQGGPRTVSGVLQDTAQPRNVGVHHVPRRLRRFGPPRTVDQLVGHDDFVRAHRQHREDAALLGLP